MGHHVTRLGRYTCPTLTPYIQNLFRLSLRKGLLKAMKMYTQLLKISSMPKMNQQQKIQNITRYPRLKVRCAPKNQKVAKILTISSNYEVDFAKCFL